MALIKRPFYSLFTKDSLQSKRHTETESEQIKIIHANKNEKKARKQYLHQIKQTLKQKTLTTDKEGNYIIRNGAILEGNITFLNTHTPYIIPHKI